MATTTDQHCETTASLRRQTLIDVLPEAVALLDEQYEVLECNEAFAGQVATVRNELLGADLRQLTGQSSLLVELVAKTLDTRRERRIRDNQGENALTCTCWPLLDGDGAITAVVLRCTSRPLKTSLEYQEEGMPSLLEKAERLANVGAWEWDVVDDRLTLSAHWQTLHGCQRQGVTLDNLMNLVHPNDYGQVTEAFKQTLATGQPYELEHRIIREDTGAVRWVHARGEVTADLDGSPRLVRGVSQDITAQKEANEERRQLQRATENLHKLDALGRLSASVSHEYNNLLMGIIGYAHHLNKRLPANTELAHFAAKILELSEQATQVSRRLLDFSRAQRTEPTPLGIDELLQDTVATFKSLIGEDILVELDLSSAARVEGDINRLREVMVNVMLNARDAMPRGGKLKIASRIAQPSELTAAELELEPSNLYARITFSDTGSGMSAQTMEHAIEPFFTTKPPGSGTGLGLSSSLGIIKAHRGGIDIESELGAGTTITLYLPLLEEARLPS